MYAFDFERPKTIADAVKALGREDAQALGGGQTLIPTLKQRLASPSKLVSLSGIAEMKGVTAAGGVLTVGGGTTHATVAAAAASASLKRSGMLEPCIFCRQYQTAVPRAA